MNRLALKQAVLFVVFLVLFIEAVGKFAVGILPTELKNLILTKYTFDPQGIYFRDSTYNMHKMKPNFVQPKMFYNNYRWYHQTNSLGIRDKKDMDAADIVLLGDSMIYGHGVNFEDTMGFNLEKISRLVVPAITSFKSSG